MADPNSTTAPFSAFVRPGHARLTVLAGACPAGLSFSLGANAHEAGREAEQIALGEDGTISEHHATFSYRGETLQVADRGSANGVYVRIRGPRTLNDGDWFRVGSNTFRFHAVSAAEEYPSDDGTLHFVSPPRPVVFRVQQILEGGVGGASVAAEEAVTIGREDADFAFAGDPHTSRAHAKVSRGPNGFQVEDLGSTNGTYVRIGESAALTHGDLLYLGDTLLRVDIT